MIDKQLLQAFYDLIDLDHAPRWQSTAFLNRVKKRPGFDILDILIRGILLNPDEYLDYGRYIPMVIDLNSEVFADCLNDKRELFRRIPEYMGREWIDLEAASDDEIIRFVRKHGKAVLKINKSSGEGLRILDEQDTDESVIAAARSEDRVLAEQFITQHPALSKAFPDAVNTMRIHTIRDSNGVHIPLNAIIRFGTGHSKIDNLGGNAGGYAVLLDHEGRCMASARLKVKSEIPIARAYHLDTGFKFSDLVVPYYREAEKICLAAALKVPEQRYVGWDIAITETGPVIVEGNSQSAIIKEYESLMYLATGRGSGNEWLKMLACGMEGAEHDVKEGLCFLNPLRVVDSVETQFLSLLTGWMFRAGYQFANSDASEINGSIRIKAHELVLDIKGSEHRIALPEALPSDIFEADRLAKRYYYEEILKKII